MLAALHQIVIGLLYYNNLALPSQTHWAATNASAAFDFTVSTI